MSLNISSQSIGVLIDNQDSQGSLILADNQLVAVLVRLDSENHPAEIRGRWRLVVGFGKCNVLGPPVFKTPEEAAAWVEQRLRSSLEQG